MVFGESVVGTAKEIELAVSLPVRLLGKWVVGHVISRLHLPALHTGACEAQAFPACRACEHEQCIAPLVGSLQPNGVGGG